MHQVAAHVSRAVTRFTAPVNCFPQECVSFLTRCSLPPRPYLEEPRNVIVHKGAEPLGISIVSGENGGIFVSKVTEGSIAHQAGLEYGDQLLEVRAVHCCQVRNGTPLSVHDSAAHKSMVASQKTHTKIRALISTVASFSSITLAAAARAATALLLLILLLLQQLLQPVVGLSHTCASYKQVSSFNSQVSSKSKVALVRIKTSSQSHVNVKSHKNLTPVFTLYLTLFVIILVFCIS